MNEPAVSVVVSTYNRPKRLARLLEALRGQTFAAFEVVVVDNGSDPATGELLDRSAGLSLRTLRLSPTAGPAGGRNHGWRHARAPLVAFTDDDCEPTPGWLAALMAAAESRPGAILQGPTRPLPAEGSELGLLSHTVRIEHLGPQYETCNILYPRAVLEALDGFDERFGTEPAGEDTDLAWRAIARGVPTAFVDDALVHHAVERGDVRSALRRAGRWSAVVRVFAQHPETRSMLYRRRFWNVWHYLMYRSLLALAGPRWLTRLLVWSHLMTLRRRLREADPDVNPALGVAFLLVYDAVECWAVARGALRHRTLVL